MGKTSLNYKRLGVVFFTWSKKERDSFVPPLLNQATSTKTLMLNYGHATFPIKWIGNKFANSKKTFGMSRYFSSDKLNCPLEKVTELVFGLHRSLQNLIKQAYSSKSKTPSFATNWNHQHAVCASSNIIAEWWVIPFASYAKTFAFFYPCHCLFILFTRFFSNSQTDFRYLRIPRN